MNSTIDLDFSKLPLARRLVIAWHLLRGHPTRVSERVAWWSRPAADYLQGVERWQHFDAIAKGPIDVLRQAHDERERGDEDDDGGEP